MKIKETTYKWIEEAVQKYDVKTIEDLKLVDGFKAIFSRMNKNEKDNLQNIIDAVREDYAYGEILDYIKKISEGDDFIHVHYADEIEQLSIEASDTFVMKDKSIITEDGSVETINAEESADESSETLDESSVNNDSSEESSKNEDNTSDDTFIMKDKCIITEDGSVDPITKEELSKEPYQSSENDSSPKINTQPKKVVRENLQRILNEKGHTMPVIREFYRNKNYGKTYKDVITKETMEDFKELGDNVSKLSMRFMSAVSHRIIGYETAHNIA